jgi:hypothetical protein
MNRVSSSLRGAFWWAVVWLTYWLDRAACNQRILLPALHDRLIAANEKALVRWKYRHFKMHDGDCIDALTGEFIPAPRGEAP